MEQQTDAKIETSTIETSLLREITDLPPELRVPENLKVWELEIVHEAGHATVALALGAKVIGYRIGDVISWAVEGNTFQVSKRGGVTRTTAKLDLNPEDQRKVRVGGIASELAYFNYVKSTRSNQETDRKKAGIGNYLDFQKIGDDLADLLESEWKTLYFLVFERISKGMGFDDLNTMLISGKKVSEVINGLLVSPNPSG
jgi:hypothetical protein